MRVIKFDAGELFTDDRFGSLGFTVTPVGNGRETRMHLLRLDPDGVIGEHPAVDQQLLVVLSGAASVSTPIEGPHEIAVGQAAAFEPGEMHTTRSRPGLVALAIEGHLDLT